MQKHAEIAKRYTQESFKQENKMIKDLTNKIYLQQESLKALPEALRIQAEIIDHTPPPSNRPFPIWDSAPIKGFDATKYLGNQQDQDDENDEDTNK